MENKNPKRPKEDDENALLRSQGSAYDPLADNIPYAAEPVETVLPDEKTPMAKAGPASRAKQSHIQRMLTLFEEHRGEAFYSLDEKPFVAFVKDGQKTVLPLSAAVDALGLWLYKATGQPTFARLRETLRDHLTAMAGSAPKRQTWIRVAELDSCLYLDLARDDGQTVKVSANGWEFTNCPPVYFVRTKGMLPLPIPVQGGHVGELFEYINVPDDSSRALVLGWLIGTLKPLVPCGILAIHGEQGCAKTTLTRILCRLIDPHVADVRQRPKDEETVMVAANNAWILPYDNLSGMAPWLSDLLCMVSTRGSYTARKKYTDGEEVIIKVNRPVILNGIEDAATRPDLMDRIILLHPPVIPEANRKTETKVLEGFTGAHPRILGALLSAASEALRLLPHTRVVGYPRMADFTQWAVAAEQGLGLSAGAFLSAYRENRRNTQTQVLESSPLVEPIEKLMAGRQEWRGTPTELFDELAEQATAAQRARPGWPKDAARLTAALRRIATNLRNRGLDIGLDGREPGGNRRRMVTINQTPQPPMMAGSTETARSYEG